MCCCCSIGPRVGPFRNGSFMAPPPFLHQSLKFTHSKFILIGPAFRRARIHVPFKSGRSSDSESDQPKPLSLFFRRSCPFHCTNSEVVLLTLDLASRMLAFSQFLLCCLLVFAATPLPPMATPSSSRVVLGFVTVSVICKAR